MVEFGQKLDEKMKPMLRETKEPIVMRRKLGLKPMVGPEGRKKHPTRKE